MKFLLFIEYPATGHISVLTFATRAERALLMITLAAQPVVLTTQDYH